MIQLDPAQLLYNALLIAAVTTVAISAVFGLVLHSVRERRGLGWLVGWLFVAATVFLCACIVRAPGLAQGLSLAATLTAIASSLAHATGGYRFGQRKGVPRGIAVMLAGGACVDLALWWRFYEAAPFVAPEFGLCLATFTSALALYPLCRDRRRGGARTAFALSMLLGALMARTTIVSVVLAASSRVLDSVYWIVEILGGTLVAFLLALGEIAAILDEMRIELVDSHSSLELAMKGMEAAAKIDSLTGLYNRYAFYAQIEQLRAEGSAGAIAILDLNNLKEINDTFGHHAGDEALVRVARTLRDVVRATDFVCRWGGDEFVIVLCGATLDIARARLTRMDAPPPLEIEDHSQPVMLTVSWGIARLGPDVDASLREADRELYRQKHLVKTASGRLASS